MFDLASRQLAPGTRVALIVVAGATPALVGSSALVAFGPALMDAWLAGAPLQVASTPALGLTALAVALAQAVAMVVTAALARWQVVGAFEREIASRADALAQQQSVLAAQLREAAAQEERNRLARDLHDTIKQQLFSINVAAATAQRLQTRDPDGAAQHIQRVRDLSQAAMAEMKALLTQLRPHPLETVGLIGAIQEQLEALRFRAEVETELRHDPLPDGEALPPGGQEAIFRTVQEALSNIARHARARNVRVALSREVVNGRAWLQVTIADDGQGFDPATTPAGMGLSNMRARIAEMGGVLEAQSAPFSGATIRFRVPLIQPAERLAQARREKEERFQRVYWATTLFSFALAALFLGGMVVVGFLVEVVPRGRLELWGSLPVMAALGAAVIAPLLIYNINLRRRLRSDLSSSPIWLDVLRCYDAGQSFWLLLMAAWGCLSFRAYAVAAAAFIAGGAALVINLRLYRRLDRHLADWATPQLLRARRNEQALFLGFGAIFLIAIYAGLFGSLSEVRLFHDHLDGAWFVSFLAIAYPIVIVGSLFGLVTTHWQYRRLVAEEDSGEALGTSRASADAPLRRLRMIAAGLAVGYALVAASSGALFVEGGLPWALLAVVVSVGLLVGKWRVERALTARVGAWSSLQAQRSALWIYTVGLIFDVATLGGGLVGGLLAVSAPEGAAVSLNPSPIMAWAWFSAVAMIVAALPYLLLQAVVTRRRVQILEAAVPQTT